MTNGDAGASNAPAEAHLDPDQIAASGTTGGSTGSAAPPPAPPASGAVPPPATVNKTADNVLYPSVERVRIEYAFLLSAFGLALAAALVWVLLAYGFRDSTDIVAVVGLFTSILGTLVGAFFGVQIGSAAGEAAVQQADKSAAFAGQAVSQANQSAQAAQVQAAQAQSHVQQADAAAKRAQVQLKLVEQEVPQPKLDEVKRKFPEWFD